MLNDIWVQRTKVDYAQGWNGLLPQGVAWPRDPTSVLQTVITGQSQIWGDEVEVLAALLLNVESDPRKTNVLLPDWEKAFGLPDICFPAAPADIPTREINLVTKMTLLGAQSRQFFIAQGALAGQTMAIREYSPYQCGISGCGDTTNIDPDGAGNFRWGLGQVEMRFVWTVSISALTGSFNGADLSCLMNRWKPAHTAVVFDYSALQEFRFTRPWNSGLLATL